MSLLLVTHDLELASSMADQVSVMYAGCVVETSPGRDFFRRPRHPYSQALLEASPQRGLKPIPGQSPGVEEDYAGCPFAPRCPHADDRCRSSFPDAAFKTAGPFIVGIMIKLDSVGKTTPRAGRFPGEPRWSRASL